ncbi:MAG: DUF4262 domain-containing protein [Planctomycetota bacterium]
MRARTDGMLPAELAILADVDEHGVHIAHVDGDDDEPTFSFTIGLWHSFDQPEVIVFGMPEEVAAELLNSLADEAAENRKFLAETRHEGLLVGYPVRLVALPRERYRDYLQAAVWAYEGDDFPAVQLVWPDKQGRWPWEPGVREGFASAQPVPGRIAP